MTNSSNNASWLKWAIAIFFTIGAAAAGLIASELSEKVDLKYYRTDQSAIQKDIDDVRRETLKRIENIEDKMDDMKDDTTKVLIQSGRIEERLRQLDKTIKENHNGTHN